MSKEKKNLIFDADQYNAYYGNFRGVDFSNDHTQVNRQRFAYLVNMYKDYQSAQGQAIETIPGFRAVANFREDAPVYGIHEYTFRRQNKNYPIVLFHVGTKLYVWRKGTYPEGVNVEKSTVITLPKPGVDSSGLNVFTIAFTDSSDKEAVYGIYKLDGTAIEVWDFSPYTLTIKSGGLFEGDMVRVVYAENEWKNANILFTEMNEQNSVSFTFNNKIYIIDGKNFLVYDGRTAKCDSVLKDAYVPLTYRYIVPGTTAISDAGKEYEQRNILQPKFRHTYVADGVTTEYYLNENELEEICEVKVYGEVVTEYTPDLEEGKIVFTVAPKKPETVGFPEGHDGVEITAKKTLKAEMLGGLLDISNLITQCSLACVFDQRVFLSGNPSYPGHVYYCENNSTTGHIDPTYFGALDYFSCGVGPVPITGMLPVSNSLLVLKGDTKQDGSIYYVNPYRTGEDLIAKTYTQVAGLSGIGCVGACINFFDDPVFVSRLGLEAVGQLSTRNERAIEHRSSLIDAKLTGLDLSKAQLEEWNGYLVLLAEGKIFLADSRQRFTHESGVMQYEWYYLEDIGKYNYQYTEYIYASKMPSELDGKTVRVCPDCKKSERNCTCEENTNRFIDVPLVLAESVYDIDVYEINDLTGTTANYLNLTIQDDSVQFEFEGKEYSEQVFFVVSEAYDPGTHESLGLRAYYCETNENQIGGTFCPPTVIKAMNNTLYFGASGTVFAFNFDKRSENGDIPPQYYTFNGRTIFSGCATKMDNCDIPHLTKSTIKKSTVVKTKTLSSSAIKIKVRTNKKPYEQIARVNTGLFSFDGMDFSDLSFNTQDHGISTIKEKEKKWVEKQYFIYSDEFMKPFALYNLSYRYKISGRYKE